eukprot:3452241-Alexandrium_andersonii.AAC.1
MPAAPTGIGPMVVRWSRPRITKDLVASGAAVRLTSSASTATAARAERFSRLDSARRAGR